MYSVEKINHVRTRLELFNKLDKVKSAFLSDDDYEEFGPPDQSFKSFNHKYRHFLALRFYLLLTCFDILGANDKFITYNNWINSKAYMKKFLEQYKPTGNLQKDAKELHKGYLESFGMTVGFKRFINDFLDDDLKEMLFASVKVESASNNVGPLKDKKDITSHGLVVEFLLKVRNQFTHEGVSLANGYDYWFQHSQPIFSEKTGQRLYAWDLQHVEKKGSTYRFYRTKRWPEVLLEVIEGALAKNI